MIPQGFKTTVPNCTSWGKDETKAVTLLKSYGKLFALTITIIMIARARGEGENVVVEGQF